MLLLLLLLIMMMMMMMMLMILMMTHWLTDSKAVLEYRIQWKFGVIKSSYTRVNSIETRRRHRRRVHYCQAIWCVANDACSLSDGCRGWRHCWLGGRVWRHIATHVTRNCHVSFVYLSLTPPRQHYARVAYRCWYLIFLNKIIIMSINQSNQKVCRER